MYKGIYSIKKKMVDKKYLHSSCTSYPKWNLWPLPHKTQNKNWSQSSIMWRHSSIHVLTGSHSRAEKKVIEYPVNLKRKRVKARGSHLTSHCACHWTSLIAAFPTDPLSNTARCTEHHTLKIITQQREARPETHDALRSSARLLEIFALCHRQMRYSGRFWVQQLNEFLPLST